MPQLKFHFLKPTLLILGLAFGLTSPLTPPVSASSCADLYLVFARGSGEPLSGPNFSAFKEALDSTFKSSSLSYEIYELGSSVRYGDPYPAVSTKDPVTNLGALFSSGDHFRYGKSVNSGKTELINFINRRGKSCPLSHFALIGYSQGAQVISQATPFLPLKKILYIATFGDPKLLLPEGAGKYPKACFGQDLSPYRHYVPDCTVHQGILKGNPNYQKFPEIQLFHTWCEQSDFICGSRFNFDAPLEAHTSYSTNHLYFDFAYHLLLKLKPHFNNKISLPNLPIIRNQAAFIFDSTDSMRPFIDRYKNQARTLISKILTFGGEVALFEYRDLKDPYLPQKLSDFGSTQSEIFEKLEYLKTDNGGDEKESLLSALKFTLNQLRWKPGALKSIFIFTDAGYHSPDLDGTTESEIINLALSIDPVNLYVITSYNNTITYLPLTTKTSGKIYTSAPSFDTSLSLLSRPNPIFSLSHYQGTTGQNFNFTLKTDLLHPAFSYDWDLDGDGIFESHTKTPSISKSYSKPFSGFLQVKITDTNNQIGTGSAKISVTNTVDPAPTIISSQLTSDSSQAKISLHSLNTKAYFLSLDQAPLGITYSSDFTINLASPVHSLTITPISPTGFLGQPHSLSINSPTDLLPPNPSSLPTKTTPSNPIQPLKTPTFKLKAPDTGVPNPSYQFFKRSILP